MNTKHQLTLDSKVCVSQSQASSKLLGETVILELESGVYYGLNETGSLIWNLLQSSQTLIEIRDTILSNYDVEQEQCSLYIIQLVQNLLDKGLVVMENEVTV